MHSLASILSSIKRRGAWRVCRMTSLGRSAAEDPARLKQCAVGALVPGSHDGGWESHLCGVRLVPIEQGGSRRG